MSVNSLACSGLSRPGSRTGSCHATMMKPLVTVVATVGESPRASSILQSVSPDGLARPGGGGPSPRRLKTVLRGADEQGADERLGVALKLFDLGLSGRPRLKRTSTRRRGLPARLVFDELVGGQSRDVPRRLLGRALVPCSACARESAATSSGSRSRRPKRGPHSGSRGVDADVPDHLPLDLGRRYPLSVITTIVL